MFYFYLDYVIITYLNQPMKDYIMCAAKATSVHLQIVEQATHNTILRKTFFNSKGYNEYVESEAVKEKFPKPTYYYVKETY